MARTRPTGGPTKGEAKNTARRQGARARITTAQSIPARGEEDAYGETFDGLPGDRLAYRGLGNDELGGNSVDGRVVAPASITQSHVSGRFGGDVLNVPGLTTNPNSEQGRALDVKTFKDHVSGLPDFSKFARDTDVASLRSAVSNQATPAEVKKLIKKHVKPQSTRGL